MVEGERVERDDVLGSFIVEPQPDDVEQEVGKESAKSAAPLKPPVVVAPPKPVPPKPPPVVEPTAAPKNAFYAHKVRRRRQ